MTSMHCITVTVWIKGSRIFLTSFPFIFCGNHEEVETTFFFFPVNCVIMCKLNPAPS